MLRSLEEVPVAKRVVHDTPIYILLVFCMYLHHVRDRTDPRSGVTHKALRTLFAARGTDEGRPKDWAPADRARSGLRPRRLPQCHPADAGSWDKGLVPDARVV